MQTQDSVVKSMYKLVVGMNYCVLNASDNAQHLHTVNKWLTYTVIFSLRFLFVKVSQTVNELMRTCCGLKITPLLARGQWEKIL